MIGIDTDRRLFYEGSGNYGHGIWPSPFISIASILPPDWSTSDLSLASDVGWTKLVFREDFFDAVTRIRRGRFYVNPGTQPQEWHVQTHPAFKEEVGQRDFQGNMVKRLYTFQLWSAFSELRSSASPRLVALGFANAFTLWKVVDIERIVTGEDLVTMRARSPMGVLPELSPNAIPSVGRDKVLETTEKVVDAAYREGPEAIVERCRHAAQAALGLWMDARYGEEKWRTVDLGQQATRLATEPNDTKPVVVANTASTLARLHVRAKPNEQILYGSRILVEEDSEAAINLLGLMFREFQWCRR